MKRKYFLNAFFLTLPLSICPVVAQQAEAEMLSAAQVVANKLRGRVNEAHNGELLVGAYITVFCLSHYSLHLTLCSIFSSVEREMRLDII